MDVSSDLQGIDLLFKKLGHEIAEIRTRALTSLLSKVEHKLVHIADLLQERKLYIRLLEWFNFKPTPMQDEVLSFLLTLTKHSVPCEILASLGGMKFFSDLRGHIDSALKPKVDVILDRLLHVSDADMVLKGRCIYSADGEKNDDFTTDSKASETIYMGKQYQKLVSEYFKQGSKTTGSTHSDTYSLSFSSQNIQSNDSSFLLFDEFPWHSLTATDRHVLASTASSLCSSSPHLVRNACAFLLDVVFQDFPAEIFLQRPTIAQTLLTLLNSRPGNNLMQSAAQCLCSLTKNLTVRLNYHRDPSAYCPKQGLPFQRAKNSSHHQGFSTTPSSIFHSDTEGEKIFKRPGGDGQEISSSSSSVSTMSTPISSSNSTRKPLPSDEENDLAAWQEDNDAMHAPQMTLSAFCIASLHAVTGLLRTESASMFLHLYEVSLHVTRLLHTVTATEHLWNAEANTAAKTMQEDILSVFEYLSDAVIFHYHLHVPSSSVFSSKVSEWTQKHRDSKHDCTMHRVAYQAASTQLLRQLTLFLPIDKVKDDLQHSIRIALYIISSDEGLVLCMKNVASSAEVYLEKISGEEHQILKKLRRITSSINHAYEFLREYEEFPASISSSNDQMDSLLELASSSVDSVSYHSQETLVSKIINVISVISAADNIAEEVLLFSKKLLLKLLAHSLTHVRMSAYSSCFDITSDVLNVETAAENTTDKQIRRCRFLLDRDVLYEVCHHGLGDSLQLVASPSHDLIILLLKSKLFMDEEHWRLFQNEIKPVMPVLQSYTGETERLQIAIYNYINPTNNDVPIVERLAAYLRALLLKKRMLRSNCANYLVQLLSTLQVSMERDTPQSPNLALVAKAASIVGLTDLLITENPLSLNAKDNLTGGIVGNGVFSEDALIRMLGIFRSRSLETSVRRSALQQVSVMLSDPSLHEIFLSSDGLETIKDHLFSLVAENSVLTDAERTSTNACVSVIRSLCISNTNIREQFHCNQEILLMLLRAIDLCRLSATSSALIAGTLGILIFHDVLVLKDLHPVEDEVDEDEEVEVGQELSLPLGIITRYQMSFLCPGHHTVSIHREVLLSNSCDSLTAGPPAYSIRVAIAVAKHNSSIEEVLSANDAGALHLSEIAALTYSHAPLAINALIASCVNSKSHGSVCHILNLLRTLLLTSPCRYSSAFVQHPKWQSSINKFLQLPPTCVEDEVLLNDLVLFLRELVTIRNTFGMSESLQQLIVWLANAFITNKQNDQRPLLYVLESSEPQPETAQYIQGHGNQNTTSSTIRRQLCKNVLFLTCQLSRLLSHVDAEYLLMYKFQIEMCRVLLIRLKLADAPQFYDLPSMEVSLNCLVHIAATFQGWSSVRNRPVEPINSHSKLHAIDNVTLCRQLMTTLLEIVSAFHIESRGSSLSYMGKGVSKCATKCIVHLMREITKYSSNEIITDFIHLLEIRFSRQNPTSHSIEDHNNSNEYDWLLPLWSARDPSIRYCGITIASILCQSEIGCNILSTNFVNYPGSLWGMVLYVLLDHSECSLVRAQAANVFCNLISHKFSEQSESTMSSETWQGPALRNNMGEPVTGMSAVIALLHHMKFFSHILVILDRHYNKMCIQPIIINSFPAITSNSLSSFPSDSAASVIGSDIGAFTQQSMSSLGINTSSVSTSKIDLSTTTSNDEVRSNLENIFESADLPPTELSNREASNMARESAVSSSSSLPVECQSVTSPALITNIARLLSNLIALAPFEIMQKIEQNKIPFYLLNIMNPAKLFKKLYKFQEMINSGWDDKEDISRKKHKINVSQHFLQSLLQQYTSTCDLLTTCGTHDRTIPLNVLRNDEFLKKILTLLSVTSPSPDWKGLISKMHVSAMRFISIAVQTNLKIVPLQITNVLSEVWQPFSESVTRLLDTHHYFDDVCVEPCLQMLASIFSCIALYDNQSSDKNSQFLLITHSSASDDASRICLKLVTIFETVLSKPLDHRVLCFSGICASALQSLLAISKSAKYGASQAGFLERLTSEMKQLIDKLNILTTVVHAKTNKRSKKSDNQQSVAQCEQIVQLLLMLCSMCNNLMFADNDVKMQAVSSNISQVISKLWSRTPMYNQLVVPLLKLMETYTCSCESACTSLASTPCTMSSQSSLMVCIVKLVRDVNNQVKIRNKVPPVLLRTSFLLLTNCTASQECRATLWKMNLLNEFASVADNSQHPKKTRQQHDVAGYWMRVLHMLSYHTDGQLNILKIKDILEIFIELYNSNVHQLLVLKTIRNLCFHNASKLRLASHGTLVAILKQELLNNESNHRMAAAQSLWALLVNSQKSKVHLKGANLSKQVEMVLAKMKLVENVESLKEYKNALIGIMAIMSI